MRPSSRQQLIAIAIGLSLGVVAGCSRATSSAPSSSSSLRVTTLDGQAMTPCRLNSGAVALCGTLAVYENRSAGTGRQIDLKVAVIPAKDAVPQPDPVFFLAGGPGGAATESWANAGSIFPELHQHRDIVLVDQRGTGGSNALAFPTYPDLTGLTLAQQKVRLQAFVETVLASLPGDPTMYTTAAAMDDLDQVRQALGYQRINVYGGSYGATAAQYYLRQHPDRVRTIILDGGTLLNVPLLELVAPNSQAALNRVFDRCEAQATCQAAYPLVRREFTTLLDQLRVKPLTIDLSTIGRNGSLVVDHDAFASAIHTMLLSSQTAASLPLAIHDAVSGDFRPIARVLAQNTDTTNQLVMSAMVRCFEGWARFDPVTTRSSGAGSYLLDAQEKVAEGQALACPFLPLPPLPSGDALPVESSLPVLLLNGSTDPQDPPSNVGEARTDMPNSLTVVVRDQGHTVGHLGCLPAVVAAFVGTGSTKRLNTSCVQRMPVPAFAISG